MIEAEIEGAFLQEDVHSLVTEVEAVVDFNQEEDLHLVEAEALTVEMMDQEKCLEPSVITVEKNVRFHSDQQAENQFTAVTVLKKWVEEMQTGMKEMRDRNSETP